MCQAWMRWKMESIYIMMKKKVNSIDFRFDHEGQNFHEKNRTNSSILIVNSEILHHLTCFLLINQNFAHPPALLHLLIVVHFFFDHSIDQPFFFSSSFTQAMYLLNWLWYFLRIPICFFVLLIFLKAYLTYEVELAY